MAQPTPTQVHTDRVLTNISVAYRQKATQFIAGKVFPVVPVDKQSDLYYIYTKADWFRDEAKPRAPATESAGSGYGLSTDTYKAEVFALHKDIPDQVLNNADAPINPRRDATNFVTQRLLLRQEIQWVSDYFTTGVWGTDSTPATLWDDANADPVDDVETGKEQILATTGQMANTLVLGYPVYRRMKNNPAIIDRIKYTTSVTGRTITPELLASVFDVERVLVAGGIKNTGNEGETAAYSFIHGKHALLAYVAPEPSELTPSAGYTFEWRGVSDGLGETLGVVEIDMPTLRATRVEGQIAYDNKVVAADAGYFFANAVS